MGTNGVGKTSLMKAISGNHARSGGTLSLDGAGGAGAAGAPAGADGHRLRAAGAHDLSAADRAREPRDGLRLPAEGERAVPDRIFELFPF
jgi:urea transport system ATP-binding protein